MRKDSLLQNYYYSKLPKAKVGMETGDPNQPYHPITNPQGYKVKLSDVLKVSEKNRQEALDTRPQIKQGHKELPYEKKAREERLRKEAQENSALAQTMGLFTPSGSNPAAGAIGAETFTNMNPLITGPIMSTSRLYGAGRSLVDDKTANPYFGSDKGVVGNVLGGLNLAGDIGMLRMGLRKPTGSFNPEPNPANRIEWSDFTERNGRVKQAWADAQKRKAGIPTSADEYRKFLQEQKLKQQAGDVLREKGMMPDPRTGGSYKPPTDNLTWRDPKTGEIRYQLEAGDYGDFKTPELYNEAKKDFSNYKRKYFQDLINQRTAAVNQAKGIAFNVKPIYNPKMFSKTNLLGGKFPGFDIPDYIQNLGDEYPMFHKDFTGTIQNISGVDPSELIPYKGIEAFQNISPNQYGGSIKEYGGPLVEYYKGKMTGPNIFANGGPGDGKKSLPPIYTDDPRKVKAYQDSLNEYKSGERWADLINKHERPYEGATAISESDLNKVRSTMIKEFPQVYGYLHQENKPISGYPYYVNMENNEIVGPIVTHLYKKPVQPYILKPKPTLKRKVSMVEPISIQSSYTPSLRMPNIPNIQIPSVQQGKYRASYWDPEMKDWNERAFMSQQESDQFANEMSQRGYAAPYGTVTQRVQYANGGVVNLNSIIKQNREDRDNNYYSGGISKYEQGGQANKYYYNKGYGVPRFDDGGQGPCPAGQYWDTVSKKCVPRPAPFVTSDIDEYNRRMQLATDSTNAANSSRAAITENNANSAAEKTVVTTNTDPTLSPSDKSWKNKKKVVKRVNIFRKGSPRRYTTDEYKKKLIEQGNNPKATDEFVDSSASTISGDQIINPVAITTYPTTGTDYDEKGNVISNNANMYVPEFQEAKQDVKYKPVYTVTYLDKDGKQQTVDLKNYENWKSLVDRYKGSTAFRSAQETGNKSSGSLLLGQMTDDPIATPVESDTTAGPNLYRPFDGRFFQSQPTPPIDKWNNIPATNVTETINKKWGGPTRMNRFGYLVDRKANGGSPYPINLNLPQYKQPSGFFTGYTYGNSPEPNVNIYGVGAYGEKRVSPRTTLSGDISSQSVTYPGGSQMFNKPMYGVGMKYRFAKGGLSNNGEYEKEVFNNFPTPYSNEFVDKYQKDYNTFYTPPRYYGHDDGYDAYLHSIKGKAPFNTTIQEDLGPTWEYRGTHMQTKNFPSDWQRRIDKGKATKEDFKYYPNYIQDQNIGDIQAAGLTHYLQSQSKKPSFSFYKNGGDISIPKLPNTKGPLLQFYYAKTGGELVGRSRKKA